MKTSERHQLKTNEIAGVVSDLTERFEAHRSRILWAGGIAVAILVIGGGYWSWKTQQTAKAATALSDAMAIASAPVVPPAPAAQPGQPAPPAPPAGSYPSAAARAQAAIAKFREVAAAYGTTEAGLAAQYQTAALLAETGNTAEAEKEFKAVVERAGTGLYGTMARLGLAEVQVRAGQFDPAIATFQELASRADADLPVDGLLMQLGRAYALSGRKAEALRAYQRVVDEFPDSLFATEARREVETLKAGTGSSS